MTLTVCPSRLVGLDAETSLREVTVRKRAHGDPVLPYTRTTGEVTELPYNTDRRFFSMGRVTYPPFSLPFSVDFSGLGLYL